MKQKNILRRQDIGFDKKLNDKIKKSNPVGIKSFSGKVRFFCLLGLEEAKRKGLMND